MMLKTISRNASLKRKKRFNFTHAVKVRSVIIVCIMALIFSLPCFTEEDPVPEKAVPAVLKKAVLCEKIVRSNPVNEGVVFSSGLQRLFCFTYFDPVYSESRIYHKYYFNDKFINKYPLSIKPPSFATYSRIELRESDKGPWRVEITDAEDNVLTEIRFSIID